MHFSDPNRANLGQSLGFIPVEECVESSHSSKQHTLHIKCSFDQWLLATNSKENMLQWAASLHAAQPSKQTNKPVADLILAQGWLDLPKEENDEEVWARHWFVLRNTVLALFSEDMKKASDLTRPVVQLETSVRSPAPPLDEMPQLNPLSASSGHGFMGYSRLVVSCCALCRRCARRCALKASTFTSGALY